MNNSITETGLNVKIKIDCDKGFAGYVQITPDKWIDCRWDLNGKCLVTELGSFYDLTIPIR